jgi:hypothetical protein
MCWNDVHTSSPKIWNDNFKGGKIMEEKTIKGRMQ